MALQADVDSWNPYTVNEATSAGLLDLLYPRLLLEVGSTGAEATSFEPWLARSWEFSEDRSRLTFHLRRDATWSDGSPVVCADVRFTWTAQRSPALAWPGAFLKDRIVAVDCPDPHTAVFRFSAVYPDQLLDANDDAIVPARFAEVPFERWAATAWEERAVTCGPFRLGAVRPGQEVVLERDPAWWGAEEVRLARVILRVYPRAAAAFAAFREGEVDFVVNVPPLAAAEVADADSLRLVELPSLAYAFLGWNLLDPGAYLDDRRRRGCPAGAECAENEADILRLRRERPHPVLADSRVRRALTLAIDRRDVIDGPWAGHARPGGSPIVSALWAHDPSALLPYDPRAAAGLLEAAGWVDADGDGVRERGGRRLSLEAIVNADSDVRREALVRVAAGLGRVGVELVPRPLPRAEFVTRARDKAFDAVLSGFRAGTRVEPQGLLHTRAAVDRGNNIVSWSTAASDALLDRAAAEPTRERALEAWREWQALFREEQPLTVLYEETRLLGLSPRVHGPLPGFIEPFHALHRWSVGPRAGSR